MTRIFSTLGLLVLMHFVLLSNDTAFAQSDEVLITIPNNSCVEATRIAPTPIRFYHRFSDAYLAGTSRILLTHLRKRGIDFVIIDDQPWTESYAVVAKHPGQADMSLARITARALFRGDDFLIVKGSVQSFRQLREQGFVCVEIERQEIPVDATRSWLPKSIEQKDLEIVDSLIAMVSDTTIRNTIQSLQNFGTRHWNNANRDSVSRWVRAKYLETGITDVRLDSFQYNSTWQANVVATIPGAVDPSKEFIVGGHHDSYSSNLSQAPGADDNASGTAAAIEMARVLKLVNYRPAYTMRFMGFAAEEAGLRGSASYAQRARQANRDIRAMLNYDMIANRTQSSTDRDVYVVWYTGSEALSNLHSAVAFSYAPITPVLTTSYRSGSDSYSFWQQNYKSVFLIERDFSPYYHSPNDLLQYLDVPYCRDIVRAGLATLLTLDQMPPSIVGMKLRDRGNGSSLVASWDSVSVLDWANYKIYVGRSPGVYDTSYALTSRTKIISGLNEGQRYYIGVSIVDIAGREGFITEVSGIPRSTPLPPVGLVWRSLSSSVVLEWRRNVEMDLRGYNVYRKYHADTAFSKMNPLPLADTTFIDTRISVYTSYFVTAIDSSNNESAPSDTLTIPPVLGVGGNAHAFEFELYQNYPNPFNPSTQIRYEIGNQSHVVLKVFDLLGGEVSTLVNERKSPGVYVAVWNATEMSSGVYFIQLKSDARTATSRMLLIK